MGKVIITVQMTSDASIGPDIEWFDGGEQEEAGADELYLADGMLLGRKTYENLKKVWQGTPGPYADKVNALPKWVVSNTLKEPLDWNSTLVKGDLVEGVRQLKEEHDGQLLSYGCGEFAFNLVENGLVDEIRFWVHPVVWPEKERPFHGLGRVHMQMKDIRVFGNGVVLHTYTPVSAEKT
jgi:dihydrofolate reductase